MSRNGSPAATISRRDTLRKGDIAEAEFLRRALGLGLVVCKPFNEGARFDFSVHSPRTAFRVQVKSCWSRSHRGSYNFPIAGHTAAGVRPYTADQIDIIAAYLAHEDVWYIIPIRAIVGHISANLNPRRTRTRARFEPFREAWHLFFA